MQIERLLHDFLYHHIVVHGQFVLYVPSHRTESFGMATESFRSESRMKLGILKIQTNNKHIDNRCTLSIYLVVSCWLVSKPVEQHFPSHSPKSCSTPTYVIHISWMAPVGWIGWRAAGGFPFKGHLSSRMVFTSQKGGDQHEKKWSSFFLQKASWKPHLLGNACIM